MVAWDTHRFCVAFQRLSALLMDERQQCQPILDFRQVSCSLTNRFHFSEKANRVLCKRFLSEERRRHGHTQPRVRTRSQTRTAEVAASWLRKRSWVISKISVFWFRWLSALLFLISSFVRSGKSIVLLSRLPNIAFLGTATSHLGHCKFNKGSEAPVS